MAERDEKELVLGNKQLISLFFLAVALCGVFFALGYMIGHNASKGSMASLDAPSSGVPDSSRQSAVAAPVANPDVPAPPPEDGQTFTQPAREAQATPPPSTPQPAPPVAIAPTRREEPLAAPVTVAKPEAGATYIQVTALREADARNLVKTLREQNLPGTIAESSKADLFRVLVGPYRQTADVADAKAKLKALGFANAFVQKQ